MEKSAQFRWVLRRMAVQPFKPPSDNELNPIHGKRTATRASRVIVPVGTARYAVDISTMGTELRSVAAKVILI